MATATLDQIGYDNSGTWDEATDLVLPADGSRLGGIRFTGFPTQLAGGVYEQTDRLYESFTLDLGDASGSPSGTLTFYIVSEAEPAQFSNSNLPATDVQCGTLSVTSSTLDSLSLDVGPVTARYRNIPWRGVLAFTVQWTSSSGDLTIPRGNATGTTLTSGDRELDAGLVGQRWLGSRLRMDPKTGEWVREDEMVRDPLTKNLVAPENADPSEERSRILSRRRNAPPRH